MPRRFPLALLTFALSACAAQLCPPRHAEIRHPAMSCSELNQVTAAAVKRMGYNIDSFLPASNGEPGKLQGTRRTDYDDTYTISVDMRCSVSEATADAVSSAGCAGQISFPNEFRTSFEASMQKKVEREKVAAKEPPQGPGLSIEIAPLRDGDRTIGAPLSAANLMVVKVTIYNRTSRDYRLEDDGIMLVAQDGSKIEAVPAGEAAKRVARAKSDAGDVTTRLEQQALRPGPIDANGKAEGYLYVPRQAYRRATVKLMDVEAEESEGFSVEF